MDPLGATDNRRHFSGAAIALALVAESLNLDSAEPGVVQQRQRYSGRIMDKAKIILTVKTEFLRHTWDTFSDESSSGARGDRKVTIQGCPRCRKRLDNYDQFMRHLANDVLPPLVDLVLKLSTEDAPT
jgi:hypothetical protein